MDQNFNMSQFGAATKNPPWVRTAVAAQNMTTGVSQQQQIQTQMMNQNAMNQLGNPAMVQYQQQPQVFQSPMAMQQAGMAMTTMSAAAMGSSGVAMPAALATTQMFPQVATVSYPTPRSLNPVAFQTTQVVTAVSSAPPANPNPSPKQRVFTGTVTKVHDNFGFIDEDVFFQTSCCVKGSNPVIGDRVLVEASFNPNMPFKWNATRIQVLPMSGNNTQQRPQAAIKQNFNATNQSTYNAVPPPVETTPTANFISRSNQRKSGGSNRQERKERNRENEDDESERKKRREERVREREEKEKRSPSVRQRSKSPRPQPRRRQRVIPRYMVQVPKMSLDIPEADVLELRRRYWNMYIPSDFFSANFRWVDAFPPNTPFTLDRPCSFHVMNKEVDPVLENNAVLEPSDADYIFSAKVMLMSMPTMDEVLRKCCAMAEDKDADDGRDFVHPTRLVNFLVGLRGKNETMAVGGPWSPSLDGPNPEKDPTVLIKTAIRTCQALTGISLSNCTQWYRFLEIYYRRGETTHKGRTVPARVETVVLFLPDVWSCVPTRLEWDGLHLNYKKQLDRKLKVDQDIANGVAADEKENGENTQEVKREPTHYAELDPKGMKVSELRQELEARTLSPKGLKSQLIARLTKAIKTEAEKAEELEEKRLSDPEPPKPEEIKDDEKTKKEEDDKKKQDEREKVAREKRYTLPDAPHILVHPSRAAKSGKFDCTVMSLSLLLDYRPEDTKEHSFEVSLFAELFNEMLMRDFGFRIYRALHDAPERPKEEDKDKDRKKEKEKKDDKDKKCEKKNGKRDDKEDKRDDKHCKDKKEDSRSKSDKHEEEDDEEEDDEDDEDSKDSKKDKDKDDKDKKRDKDKDKKKKEKVKLYTEDPLLLLAFLYFDQSHCGYIFDKDIEELLYTLGLNLSRAQVRKLVQKVVVRDSLRYRKLTDKPQPKPEDGTKEPDKEEKDAKDLAATENLMALAFGNKRLLPVFTTGGSAGSPPSKRLRRDMTESKESLTTPEGYVMHKGCLLDVEKLMQQLQRSEKARLETENKMMNLKHDLTNVKDMAKKSANTVRDLSSELRDYKARLERTVGDLSRTKVKTATYHNMLKDIHSKILPVMCAEEVAETFEPSVCSMKCKEESDITILEGQAGADLESAVSEEEVKMVGDCKTEETEHDSIVDEERQDEDLSDVKDKTVDSEADIQTDSASERLADAVEDSRQLSDVEDVKVKAELMDYE